MADKTPTVGPFWRIWLPNRYSTPSLPSSLHAFPPASHICLVNKVRRHVLYWPSHVAIAAAASGPSACHKLSQIPFDWLGYIWFYAIFVKLPPPTLADNLWLHAFSITRGLSFVFTPVENTVDKQKAAANKDQGKRAPVLTWRMSYANERLSRDSVWH